MPRLHFVPRGVDEMRTLILIHQNFISTENKESVYVLYGKVGRDFGYISNAVLVHNSHPEPQESYQVLRSDLDQASAHLLSADPALVLLGVVHTHEGPEDPAPSATDLQTVREGYVHAILSPRHAAIAFYDAEGVIDTYTLNGNDLVNRQGEPLSARMFHTTTTEGHDR